MLSDEVIEKVIERLVRRMEQANSYILEEIGKSIKKIGTLTHNETHELIQILQYGGDYNKIAKKLAEITKLNVADIYKIFEEVAKNDYQFAEQFYNYRGKGYISWDENKQLQDQVKALAKITANEYINLTKTLAFATHDKNGKVIYTELSKKYQEVLDKAVLSVGQGKETFDSAMYRAIKELGESSIRTVDYESGRSMRVDSAVRMQMKGALRNLHNEMQQQLGEEFEADGIEISVHLNPAPDHAEVQGRQFSNAEFAKFQSDQDAVDYTGKSFPAVFEGRDRRSISQYNCYHYIFSIVLGVSKPEYTDEQLQDIINKNNEGFDFDGKHYTMYEGTQLQRQLETAVRKEKDKQTIARASGNEKLITESQQKITQLTDKYKELSNASGLPTKMDRMRVSGYKRVKTDLSKTNNNIDITLINKTQNNKNVMENNLIGDELPHRKMEYMGLTTKLTPDKAKGIMEEFENKYIDDDIEHAQIIFDDGSIYHSYGINNYVYVSKDISRRPELKKKKIKYMTHTHPIKEKSLVLSGEDRDTWSRHPEIDILRQSSYSPRKSYQYISEFNRLDLKTSKMPKNTSIDNLSENKIEHINNINYAVNSQKSKNKFGYTMKRKRLDNKK